MILVIVAAAADPPFIEIGYNETVNIDLGMINPETGEFETWNIAHPIFTTRYLNFEVIEYPGGTDSTSWFIDYKPYTVDVKLGTVLKTNVTISLTSPPIASNAIQSGLLKFRISDTYGFGDMWFPPKGSGYPPFLWFFSAAFLLKFGRWSGTVDVEYKEVSVLVKVKPFHALKFDTIPLVNLKPDQITSIPVTLENLGNYNDTYNFRIVSDSKDIMISNPSSITLAPGEQKDIYLGISAPQSVFDYGTLHNVKIQAYSIYDPNVTIDQKTIYFETRGIYVSEISGIGILSLIFILIIFIFFYLRRRRLFFEKYCIKPDKPWEIPEEKTYLDQIKKTDEVKYDEVLKMMHEEYKSALLWYKYYVNAAINKEKSDKYKEIIKEETEMLKIKKEEKVKKPKEAKFLKIFEIKKKKVSEKKELPKVEKKKLPKFEKKGLLKVGKKKLIKVEKKEEPPVMFDIEAEQEKHRKERIIQRIRRDQEQQRKKLVKGD